MVQEKQEQLLKLYRKWKSELEKNCPQFMCNDFSHPYYLHIPDDWYERKCRILVVGKEGYGIHPFDSPIEEAQRFNREYLACQLGQYGKDAPDARNPSPFWNRIRRINKLPKSDEISITWTNIDKIHRIGSYCPLLKKQRCDLHKTPTAILAEEIKLLQPNIVIFFGWYDVSLKEELLAVYQKLKQHDVDYPSYWKENRMKTISEGGISYIFTNHPNWGQRQKGYEEKVISEVNRIVCEILAEE